MMTMTSIFKRLKDIFRRPPQTGNPYGLTDGQVNALRRLRAQDEYETLLEGLDKVITSYTEALLASSSSYEDSALKNQIKGVRKAGAFVDEVIQRIDTKEENERSRRQRPDSGSRAGRRSALFGTPFGSRADDLFGGGRSGVNL